MKAKVENKIINKRYQMEVPIAGVPEWIEIKDISIDDIELDPENPRIGYYIDNREGVTEISQGDLTRALKVGNYDAYQRLKSSIEAGGGALNEIWVVDKKDGKYLCIDGNSRIQIYKDLRLKYPKVSTWQKIKAKVLPNTVDDRARNFIRLIAHLRAQNDWEAYERARMLYMLWYQQGYSEEELVNTTKLSLRDIRRWREAYKIMNEQFLPKYANKRDALLKFSYFVEYESPKIKEGMKKSGLGINDFIDWVGTDEIRRAQDVRDLKQIFDNPTASKFLKEKGFEAAKKELSHVEPSYGSELFQHVEECINGFKNMTRTEEKEILSKKDKKLDMIVELYSELKDFIPTVS